MQNHMNNFKDDVQNLRAHAATNDKLNRQSFERIFTCCGYFVVTTEKGFTHVIESKV